MNYLAKYIVLQVAFGLTTMSYVFGGTVHISGVVHGHSKSSIAHISGRAYSVGNPPMIKSHISGTEKLLPSQKLQSAQSRLIRKLKNLGITPGGSEKSTATQIKNNTNEKTKTRPVKIVERASLRDRVKERKACWKACENTWKVNFQERCFALLGALKNHCKKELFKERITCVRKSCK